MSTKEEVFKYVMNSPENTNPAVLGSLLNGIEGGGGADLPTIEVTGTYYDPNHMIYPSTSLTHKDMVDAFDAGKTCRIYAQNDNVINGSLMLTPCRVVPASGDNPRYIVFNGIYRTDFGDGTIGPTYYYQCKVQDGSTASLSQGIPASRTSIADYTPNT